MVDALFGGKSYRRRKMEMMLPRRSISGLSICLVMLLGSLCMGIGAPSVDAFDPREMLMLLDEMDSSYSRVNDYVGVFHKQERIGGKLDEGETALFKFQKPFKVYMKFIDGPSKGTEALYAEGSYENKLLVRRGGILESHDIFAGPQGFAGNVSESAPHHGTRVWFFTR